jgi:hypothetical protein
MADACAYGAYQTLTTSKGLPMPRLIEIRYHGANAPFPFTVYVATGQGWRLFAQCKDNHAASIAADKPRYSNA